MSACTYDECQRPAAQDADLCRVHQLRAEVAGDVTPPKKAPAKRTRKATAKKTTSAKADS